ncbi:MAG TPA: OmpA family protein [Polyangiaceae bacterium]|nr:OmpA family protein [Polyangiaceae bacterium]
MRIRPAFASLALLSSLSLASTARAEPLRAHGSVGAGHAVSGYQKDEYAWGAGASLSLEYPFVRQLGAELSASWLGLGQGDALPPAALNLKRETGAAAISPTLGLHFVPFAANHNGHLLSPAGLWASAAGGVALTNGLTRPMLDAKLGWDLLDKAGRIGLGPMVSFVHVFQPDRELRPDDANVLLFGVHVLYDFKKVEPVIGDRDHDGILDNVDHCPDTPEDKDGFQDTDGCPDLDNDADGIPDVTDKCPNVPEDRDGFEDADGCPELDNDKDGILDRVDKCPNEPEDNDGWDSLDGCPDPDNDADGILDVNDLCPFEPETVNGYADNDGCPDEEQVRVVGDKIVLDDRVHFFVNSAVIRHISYPLLQRLVKLVAAHPEYTHVSVEGHADERGPEDFNRKLSEERARSVLEFMVKQGISRDRLSSQGFGASRPLVDKKNEYAWLLNRRVEFTVTRQMRQGGSATTDTGTSVPSENNLDKTPPPAGPPDTPEPPPAEAMPPRKAGDNEPESATPPPEAGKTKAGAK